MSAIARFGWANWGYLAASVLAWLLAEYGVEAGAGPEKAGFGKMVLMLWLLGTAAFVVGNLVVAVIGLFRRRIAWRALLGAALPFLLLFVIGLFA